MGQVRAQQNNQVNSQYSGIKRDRSGPVWSILPKRPVVLLKIASLCTIALGIVDQNVDHRTAPVGSVNETAPEMFFRVQPQRLTAQVGVTGRIEPSRNVQIAAPFDGSIKQRLFEYGQRVERFQSLLTLDTFDLEMRLYDVEAALLKASQVVKELQAWDIGPDAVRARRTVNAAQIQLRSLQQRLQSTKRLLDKGIIAQQEYTDLLDQEQSQRLSLAGARQDLEDTLKRGGPDNLRIAELEKDNAAKRLGALRSQMSNAVVLAPVSGVVLRPTVRTGDDQGSKSLPEVGGRVSQGQLLLTVADLDSLSVVAQVDEIDINHVHEGQAVLVSGSAFGPEHATGRISYVGAQASPATDGTRTVLFDIRVDLPSLSDEQRLTARVGMSADLEITYYENPIALVVPASSIQKDGIGTFAIKKEPGTANLIRVSVTLGMASEQGVEVTSGLQAEDLVLKM